MYDQHHESPPAIIPLTIKEGEHLSINGLTEKQASYYSNGIITQVKTTLMETHVPGTPVSLNEKMAPVLTKNEEELLFSIGDDHELSFFISSHGPHRGWIRQAVTGFGDGALFTAVAAFNSRNQLFVAVAVSDKLGANNTLYITDNFNVTNFEKTEWNNYGRITGTVIRELIFWQRSDSTPPELIVKSENELYWVGINHEKRPLQLQFSSDAHSLTPGWTEFKGEEFPVVNWLEKGKHKYVKIDGRGESIGGNRAYTTIADGSSSLHPRNYKYYLAEKNQVYVKERARAERKYGPEIPNTNSIDKLIVRFVHGKETLFALAGGKMLVLNKQKREWCSIANDVQKIACSLRPSESKTNFHCFVLNSNHLASLWQDNRTKLFKRTEVILPDDKAARHVMTSTTRIHFMNDKGAPLNNHPFTLKLGESCYVQVNRDCFFGVQDKSYKVKTNGNGDITIVKHLNHLSMPILRFSSDKMDDALIINPMLHLGKKLEKESKKDLKNLRIGEGERQQKLIDPKYDNRADAMAKNLERFGESIQQYALNTQKTFISEAAMAEGVYLGLPTDPLIPELPEWAFGHKSWGITMDQTGAKFMEHSEVETLWENDSIESLNIWPDIGLFLEHIIHEALDFISITVKAVAEGLYVVFEGLGTILVNTLEALLDVIKVGLKAVLGIDLDVIVQWLGFFFNWEDIKNVHAKIVRDANTQIDWIEEKLGTISEEIDTYFENLEEKVRKLGDDGLPSIIKNLNHHDLAKNALRHGKMEHHQEMVDKFSARTKTHPGANWAIMAFSNHQDVHFREGFSLPEISTNKQYNELIKRLTELAQPIIDYFKENHAELFKKLSSETLTLTNILEEIIKCLLEVGITVLKEIAHLVIETLKVNFGEIKILLKKKIDLPFFEALWHNVLQIDPKEAEFNLLNLFLLFLAIPGTIIYKIASPKDSLINVANLEGKSWQDWVAVWLGSVGSCVLQTLSSIIFRATGLVIHPVVGLIMLFIDIACLIVGCPMWVRNDPDIDMTLLIWCTSVIQAGIDALFLTMGISPALNLVTILYGMVLVNIEEFILFVVRVNRGVSNFDLVDALVRPCQVAMGGIRNCLLPMALITAVEAPEAALIAIGGYFLTGGLFIACDVTRSTLAAIGYINSPSLGQTVPLLIR